MAVGSKILRTDLTSLYTRLNTCRNKFGLANITVPSTTTGTSVLASEWNALNTAMDNAVSQSAGVYSDQHYSKPKSFAVTAGTLIKNDIKDSVIALLNTWDGICNYVACSDYSDYYDYSDYSDYYDYYDYYDDNDNYNYGSYVPSTCTHDIWEGNYMDFGTWNGGNSGQNLG